MNNELYYDVRDISLSQRETFNNTILLLTMIKSRHYYIVGFSRPEGIIEIAFDFAGELHGNITETITLDLGSDSENLILESRLKNIDKNRKADISVFEGRDGITLQNGDIVYRKSFKKDKLIPKSVEQMNIIILQVKNEIIDFLQWYYRFFLGGTEK